MYLTGRGLDGPRPFCIHCLIRTSSRERTTRYGFYKTT
nr:MAG TPA: hypothetical protein [Caudoviricetes sp.]